MKFRMDFVTNSSSNSYIVRLSVKPQKDDIIKFDLYPNGWDESNVKFRLRSGVRNVADRIKKCRTVGELTEVLVEENSGGDINSLIENYEEDAWDEDEEDRVDLREEVQEKIRKFRNEMSKYSALDEIDRVIISELYTGWGESAYDTVEAYLYRIHPEASQNEIDVMVEDLTGGPFIPYGQVDTIINPNDGSVREEHDLSL